MPHNDGHAVAARWEAADDERLVHNLNRVWSFRWLDDPYLWHAARAVRAWIDEPQDSKTLRAVRIMMAELLRAGILDLTGSHDPVERTTADVLGAVLTYMRAEQSRKALGEHHTPPDYAEAMIAPLLGGLWMGPDAVAKLPEPGAGICDPCAGTGGLIRAAARAIYQLGGNPRDYRWFMNELDPLAAACGAVNAMTWGLSPYVVVSCADILADPDAIEKEIPARFKVLHHQRETRVAAETLARVQLLTRDDTPFGADDLAVAG
ncbi:N-6 DNA methylase [Nocardia tengchongensis]|uniref:N-6 DNA methylase n=1 Tax=Nocardia tengchongensis TaxID=2055889 RepID=UPI00364E15B8